MVTAGRDECGLRSAALHQFKAEDAAIEIERAINIGNLEMDVADANTGIDRSFSSPLPLACLCHGFAGQRRHPQCGDAISRFAQNLKTKAMEREALSRFG